MTDQELFWKSDFGNDYTNRNNGNDIILNNKNLFLKILSKINIKSLFEIGCNRGLNLNAVREIDKNISLNGVEINKSAYDILKSQNLCDKLYNNSILSLDANDDFDLVFTKGVLIHINPEKLSDVYEKIYKLSKKYILIAEYYSRDIREINYRGHTDKLYKRDFCGEIMDKYPKLKLIDYGFVYYRDSKFPLDDITWFLLEKY